MRNEHLLKQSYDKLQATLKSQKSHIDELQRSNQELYGAIDRLREDLTQNGRLIGERDSQMDALHKEIKRAMADKNDKEGLIKSKQIPSYLLEKH